VAIRSEPLVKKKRGPAIIQEKSGIVTEGVSAGAEDDFVFGNHRNHRFPMTKAVEERIFHSIRSTSRCRVCSCKEERD